MLALIAVGQLAGLWKRQFLKAQHRLNFPAYKHRNEPQQGGQATHVGAKIPAYQPVKAILKGQGISRQDNRHSEALRFLRRALLP